MTYRKQMKITKLFRKGKATKEPDDCDEIQQEVKKLEEQLKDKQDQLFQLQRQAFKRKVVPIESEDAAFVRPEKIILNNSVENLKRNLELMCMLTGVEVQSYVMNDHCCILYHMQHSSEHHIKHGLRIDMKPCGNEVTKSSLPVGFNLEAVMEDFDNVMKPDCLGAIRKALLAYYDRWEQFQALKKLITMDAELFKTLDSSHMEITFFVQNNEEEQDEQIRVTMILDYRVYDILPKNYSFKESELPEEVSETLRDQCVLFKKKPLNKAFKDIFLDGVGPYRIIQQLGRYKEKAQSQRHKRFRPNKQNYNNDDTFLPEDCSDQGEDEECAQ